MADKFLHTGTGEGSLDDGTLNIYAGILGAANLDPSQPIKTNSVRQLVSSKLDIADVYNLQSELDIKQNLNFIENDTQNTPEIGQVKIYSKTDKGMYMKNSDGVETALGGGGGGNPDFQSSTGLIEGGNIIITGASTFEITAGKGWIKKAGVAAIEVIWNNIVGLTPPNLATTPATTIYIDETGSVSYGVLSSTPQERREYILLGGLFHPSGTLNSVNTTANILLNPVQQTYDVADAIGALNLSGNLFSPNGANLQIDKTAGEIFRIGINFYSNNDNPNRSGINSYTGLTFDYINSQTAIGTSTNLIDPTQYEPARDGILVAVPNQKYTIQRIYLIVNGQVLVQYGQVVYDSIDEARANLSTETFTTPVNIQSTILRAYLILKKETTDLTNTGEVLFVENGKFGNIQGGGGSGANPFDQDLYTTDDVIFKSVETGAINTKTNTNLVIKGYNAANSLVDRFRLSNNNTDDPLIEFLTNTLTNEGKLLRVNKSNTSIGSAAGNDNQGIGAVAIGIDAGGLNQKSNAIAIGNNAGTISQAIGSICIGAYAGNQKTGDYCILIGNSTSSGTGTVPANTIILNASGTSFGGSTVNSGLYITPIRQNTYPNVLYYNSATKEITYGANTAGGGKTKRTAVLSFTTGHFKDNTSCPRCYIEYLNNTSPYDVEITGDIFCSSISGVPQTGEFQLLRSSNSWMPTIDKGTITNTCADFTGAESAAADYNATTQRGIVGIGTHLNVGDGFIIHTRTSDNSTTGSGQKIMGQFTIRYKTTQAP